jgi:Na+/proline symporter
VAGLSAYLLAVTWGMALIITEVTGFSEVVAILMVWASYTLFTLYSGSRGVILTDTIMFLLFSSIIVVTAFFIVQAAGGWASVIDSLATYADKPGVIAWHGRVGPDVYWQTPMEALVWASILGVAWGIVVAVSPWQTSRYLMARSEHVVIRSACGALIAMLLLYLVTNFAAATVNLINPDISPPESTMIWVSMNLLPTVLGAILICGVLAAGLSSASTFLSLVGFSVSHDILGSAEESAEESANESTEESAESGAGENQLSQRQGGRLRSARVAMLCVGMTVIVLALMLPRNIYWLTHFAGPLFASSWGVVAFMSIWSRRITESGAFWGMAVGFAVNVGMNALSLAGLVKWPVMADPILVGVVCSYITVAIVSRRGTITAAESAYQRGLHLMPSAERDPETVRQTLRWPKVMVVMGTAIAVLMTLFYALPYQEAVAGALPARVENAP